MARRAWAQQFGNGQPLWRRVISGRQQSVHHEILNALKSPACRKAPCVPRV